MEALGFHVLVSLFAIASFSEPAGAVLLLYFALCYGPFTRMLKEYRLAIWLVPGTILGVLVPLVISCVFLSEPGGWLGAMEWWIVALASSFLLTVYRGKSNQRAQQKLESII
jgi:hypothetical protein